MLLSVGYRADNPQALESDLRTQHLSLDVTRTHENAYGVVYEIEGPIKSPAAGASVSVRFGRLTRGTDLPRFITKYRRIGS